MDTLNALTEQLDQFKAKMDEMTKMLREQGQGVIKETFKAFFEQFPEVAELNFAIYIPYFNDGDACEWTVQELDFIPTKSGATTLGLIANESHADDQDSIDVDDYDYPSDNRYRLYEYEKPSYTKRYKTERGELLEETLQKIDSVLKRDELEPVLDAMFGCHVHVLITKDKIVTREYD